MSPVFFTDRDLGKRFPAFLINAGLSVVPHHTLFRHDTPDEVWLADVGSRGWYALTHDRRIRYKQDELDSVLANGVGLFVLVGNTTFPRLAENFLATQTSIFRFIECNERPFIAKVYRPSHSDRNSPCDKPGRVVLWLPQSK